jgi:Cu+-exporting ATPase
MIAASQKAKDPLVKPKPSASPGHQAGEHTASAAARVEYVCPMHPQIVRSEPGSCPICGMTLEPQTITADEKENPELRDMTRRF